MNLGLAPIFDDEGTEVGRELYLGQKEIAAEIGTTAVYVGDLLRRVGLLRVGSKEPTPEALKSGAALYVTVDTADGLHRYPRWRKDLILRRMEQALQEFPKPSGGAKSAGHAGTADKSGSLEARFQDLEKRVESLERLVRP